jgi:hypothetical protein
MYNQKNMDVVLYHRIEFNSMQGLNDAIDLTFLQYKASDLFYYGMNNTGELETAINRAIIACRACNVAVEKNFRVLFVSSNNGLVKEWLLSDLARKLILLNANPSNALVANLQLKLLQPNNRRHESQF